MNLDKDECAGVNDDVCNKHAHCTNSAGSFFCSCNTGYIGDGLVCKGTAAFNTNNI